MEPNLYLEEIKTSYRIKIDVVDFDKILTCDGENQEDKSLYHMLSKIPGVSNVDYCAGKGTYIFFDINYDDKSNPFLLLSIVNIIKAFIADIS